MTKDEARAAAEILIAIADGKTIQRCAHGDESWWDCDEFDFNDVVTCYEYTYRIKPEPREWWINTDNGTAMYASDGFCPSEIKDYYIKVREVIDD